VRGTHAGDAPASRDGGSYVEGCVVPEVVCPRGHSGEEVAPVSEASSKGYHASSSHIQPGGVPKTYEASTEEWAKHLYGPTRAAVDNPGLVPAQARIIAAWKRLYYCYICALVFDPETGEMGAPIKFREKILAADPDPARARKVYWDMSSGGCLLPIAILGTVVILGTHGVGRTRRRSRR
jgi:hypothetical protein